MPLKHVYEMPEYVRAFGMAHGILFVVYVLLATRILVALDWPRVNLFFAWAAAVPPFGTLAFDRTYLRLQAR